MDEPKSLDSLFREKIFRIPDYQRGYAWQREQWKDFWEDLINLSGNRSHYTGMVTLAQVPDDDICKDSKEHWLVDDRSYHIYQVVDGQQRLTTAIIFLQAFVNVMKALPEHQNKPDEEIYVSESLNLASLRDRYLFVVKPKSYLFRTYIFGYETDNPSHNYLRFRILEEDGGGTVEETFYTLNLSNAKIYFTEQLRELHRQEGFVGLRDVYRKLTRRFLFNEYVIKDEYNVFVAFETMNNRGKKLSDLELLKNRLIYLTTLYDERQLDLASRKSLREAINDAWKEVYYQLGRNKMRPLNDDEFLKAHWIIYFKYSRETGRDYIHFLLDQQFTPKKVQEKSEREVMLESPQEVRAEQEPSEAEDETGNPSEDLAPTDTALLKPQEIQAYVNSLKECAVHWFNSFYPEMAPDMAVEERQWLDRLNRIGVGYFRTLIMAVLKNEPDVANRIRVFKAIERFIFVIFRMNSAMASYANSEFYNAARTLDRREIGVDAIISKLDNKFYYTLNGDGSFRSDDFYNNLYRKFRQGPGYYGWGGTEYFLYEYETSLLSESRQKKVHWSDLLTSERDKISIEHIYPQSETQTWAAAFGAMASERRQRYSASLGNLLLLSMSINSSLQNASFEDKKRVKFDSKGQKIRNGYCDGSHSEIEVSQYAAWGPQEIKDRGLKLLKFMEVRWGIRFRNHEEMEKLLFLS